MTIIVFLEDAELVYQMVSGWTVVGAIFKTLQDKRTQGVLRSQFIKVLAPTNGFRHYVSIYNEKKSIQTLIQKSWQILGIGLQLLTVNTRI